MSLDVPTDVLAAAERGELDDARFLAVVRESLPYAWQVVTAATADRADGPLGVHEVPPPSEQARGQLLRALASNAIRGALERHFGVVLAFQNCHKVGAFAPAAVDSPAFREFVSPRGQVLNQSPQLRDC
jgi:hypothetical protein